VPNAFILGLAELEHDFALSHHSKLVSSDSLNGGRVVAQAADLDAQSRDVPTQLLIVRADLAQLLFEAPEAWQALRRQDEYRDRDQRKRETRNRERAPKQICGKRHGCRMIPRLPSSRPVLEFFTLSDAERASRAYAPSQRARLGVYFDAAERRLRSGRRLTQAVPAAVLLREAVAYYLLAAAIARGGSLAADASAPNSLVETMPELPPEPARPAALPTDDARVRAALGTRDRLYFDGLSTEDQRRARWALDRAASMLRRRVEARSVANLRGARWGRRAAVLLALGYIAFVAVRAKVRTPNVALHKPVVQSSLAYTPATGQTIVDGDTGTSFGVHTQVEDSPNVVIDLLDTYRIERVSVHNRVDGWFDDCLPLIVELSLDGQKFAEIGRRERHFDGSPPWTVDAQLQSARYVRLRVARKSYLALSEVEVFAKKK
jgi:hypothetical protein